jgi:hypothetical protein
MSVGPVVTSGTINTALSNFPVQLRNLMQQLANLSTSVNSTGDGLAYLEQIGFSSAANSENPGDISDAQYALNLIGYLNNIAGVYFGTATVSSEFNFNNAFAPMWNGQLWV